MGVISWIVLGLLAGWIAKAILPGRQPQGCLITMIVGIIGAAIGGWIGTQLGWGGVNALDIRGLALSVLGAVAFLMLLGAIRGR